MRAPRSVRSAVVVFAVLSTLGSVSGLLRDLLVAGRFGAGVESDAFLVAWTLPETVMPLLLDGALPLVVIPAVGRALARRATQPAGALDPVDEFVAATLPRFTLALAAVAGAVALAATPLAAALAPGAPDPGLVASMIRLVAASVLVIGLAGYASAVLQAHRVFGPPALTSLMLNGGIVAALLALSPVLGIRAAAVGVVVGAALMLLVQVPSLGRLVSARGVLRARATTVDRIVLQAVIPIGLYTVARQSQVLVERFFGSSVSPGAISHLNYAQKIGQLPLTLALVVGIVTFPIIARGMADGDHLAVAQRNRIDLEIVGAVVAAATAYFLLFADDLVEVVFLRGAVTAADVTETAAVLRVYAMGLLAQAVVFLVCRTRFGARATFRPLLHMGIGLLVTTGTVALLVGQHGSVAIALGNALGISTTAVLLLCDREAGATGMSARALAPAFGRIAVAGTVAAVAGLAARAATAGADAWTAAAVGGLVVGAACAGVLVRPRRAARV